MKGNISFTTKLTCASTVATMNNNAAHRRASSFTTRCTSDDIDDTFL